MKHEYCRIPPNLEFPENTIGSNYHCVKCKTRFSVFDDLNKQCNDREILCANCKGIEMVIIKPSND